MVKVSVSSLPWRIEERKEKKKCQGRQPWEWWSVFEPEPFRYEWRNAARRSVRLVDRSPRESFRFLGSFASSQNFRYRLLASSCSPAWMGQLGYHWTDFNEILMFYCFVSFVEKIQVWLKFDVINGYFTLNTSIHFFKSYLAHFFVESEILKRKIVEKIKTHFMFNNFFPPKIVPFMRLRGKILYSRTWRYGARALHAGYLRLQTQRM